jgi:hypothetical protein
MSFITDLKTEWKKAVIGLIVVIGISKGEQIIGYFETGKGLEEEKRTEEVIIKALGKEEIITQLLKNPKFVQLILESPEVKKYEERIGMELRDDIVEQVTKTDSTKVAMNSYLGKEVGIRDEQVLPLLANLLKAFDKEEIATKEELTKVVNREIRRINNNHNEF